MTCSIALPPLQAMTLQPGSDKFSSLYDDVLLYIFNFNTDISKDGEPIRKGSANVDDICLTEVVRDDHPFFMTLGRQYRSHALTITLRTSQVCQRWRQLLLASSSTWSRLIDLDILSKTDPKLREEVVRRAGSTSRLSVRGFRIPYGSPTCDFAFGLIRDHWTRLEWVDLYIQTDVKLSRDQSRFWSTITTPAPNLRHFTFVFSIPVTTNPQMLTTNAPALRELCTSPSSPLHLNAPWLHQLTFLSIDGVGEPRVLCTLPEFLGVLSNMPNIATLRLVFSRIAEGVYDEYPHVQLPTLRKLVLEDQFNTCFSVLRHLAPSSQCALDIRAGHPHDIPNEEYWKLEDSLTQYLGKRSYNDRLLIDLQPKYVSFVDAYPDCYPEPTVSIRIEYDPRRNDTYAQSFFGVLPMSKFKRIKDLWFRVNLPTLFEHLLDFLPTFDDFHYSLNSVQVLKTTTQGFMLLCMTSSSIDEDDEIAVPLPKLQRIRMISPSDSNGPFDPVTELGTQFVEEFIDLFKKRKQRRRSIKHLDIRDCVGDYRKLDRCKGLKVTWLDAQYRREGQEGEYICGSGNPELLDVDD